ncbi:hypothetical protein HG530_006212 [Fusarium avenaceum]|nr:hypothetical protein HG530_006212 [Fusarium avenaceum]
MLKVQADKLRCRMLQLHVHDDLLAFVPLCIVPVCDYSRLFLELVQYHLRKPRRTALARDVVVLNVAPAKQVREAHGNCSLATTNSGDGAQNHIGFGALSPLSVHQVWFLKLVLEEPVAVGLGCWVVGHLAADNKSLDISAVVGSCFSCLFKKRLYLVDVVHSDKSGFSKSPLIRKLLDKTAWVGGKLRQVEVDAMKIQASLIRAVCQDMLLELVVAELGNSSHISFAEFPGQICLCLSNSSQLLFQALLTSASMADLDIVSVTCRMLAAYDQCIVF